MVKRKKIVSFLDSSIIVEPPFSDAEILDRHVDYETLDNLQFDKKYKDYAFKPIVLINGSKTYEIEYNFCIDTFCPNYGMLIGYIGKASTGKRIRNYRTINTSKGTGKGVPGIMCNIMHHIGSSTSTMTNTSTMMSNWSIATEIKRLMTLDMLVNEVDEYNFHAPGCLNTSTPFDNDRTFIKKGKNTSGSQRYECKSCGKRTNVKPEANTKFGYNQKRDEVLLPVFRDILSKIPITKICERNNIAPVTFYRKLERIYQRCLEFNERHEAGLSEIDFDDLYLAVDSFHYTLNNIRRRKQGGTAKDGYEKAEAKDAQTHMTATVDVFTNYVFRSDLSYATEITHEALEEDTKFYHCDHSYSYLRKNQHYRKYAYAPQPPSKHDKETYGEYIDKLNEFETRKKFVEGLHVTRSYTAIAQQYLIRNKLNYNRVIFITDKDVTLQSAIFRIYKDDFRNDEAIYLTCDYLKTTDRKENWKKATSRRLKLQAWANRTGLKDKFTFEQSEAKIYNTIQRLNFYKMVPKGKTSLPVRVPQKIYHPLPYYTEGERIVELISYNPSLSKNDLAVMINNTTLRSVNNFFQELRRDINLLERPLVSAHGSGKAYIYSNYNPKYAHMLFQIYKTYFNFVQVRKYYDNQIATPAQRIGLTSKKYELRDIIYSR